MKRITSMGWNEDNTAGYILAFVTVNHCRPEEEMKYYCSEHEKTINVALGQRNAQRDWKVVFVPNDTIPSQKRAKGGQVVHNKRNMKQ